MEERIRFIEEGIQYFQSSIVSASGRCDYPYNLQRIVLFERRCLTSGNLLLRFLHVMIKHRQLFQFFQQGIGNVFITNTNTSGAYCIPMVKSKCSHWSAWVNTHKVSPI
jgi:hypothetical protein